jgi:predicted metal-dependent hydrolase
VTEEQYDRRYLEGILHFNDCEFFEAHDVWEELWTEYQGDSRRFYQGLIQVAVCFHHFCNENIHGSRKLYHSSRKYLVDYLPWHEGIRLDKLFEQMEICCSEVINEQADGRTVRINPDLIPDIWIEAPPEGENA